jgi:hypothetical protein
MWKTCNRHDDALVLGSLLALGLLLAIPGSNAQAQTDNDINRGELSNFDRWLDDHPDARQQLNQNPSLINNSQWLSQHPGLQTFLQNHPGVRDEIKENPSQFINRERRFQASGGDITRGQLGRFDTGYLDDHPAAARQLQQNPRLIDDPQFLANHPGLKAYLNNHPEIREDIKEHPDAFMDREKRFERNGGDISRAEAAKGDRFLDSHPEIAESLRKDPGLIDNKQFQQNHPELRSFLKKHPEVKEDWKQHPAAFMNRQRQFAKHEPPPPRPKPLARRVRH